MHSNAPRLESYAGNARETGSANLFLHSHLATLYTCVTLELIFQTFHVFCAFSKIIILETRNVQGGITHELAKQPMRSFRGQCQP